jgi:ribosome-binding factor A
VGELIRRTLADVLARGDVHDPDLQATSITVGEVTVSPDLRVATAWVLPLGGRDPERAVAALARNRGELRRAVSRQMTTKVTPDLRFRVDETFDRLDDARRLFASDEVRRDLSPEDGEGEDRG